MKEEFIKDGYLELIGMSGKRYRQVELDCEICGRFTFELILDKGRIGLPGQYGPVSIMQCRHCGHVMLNPRYEPQFYIDYYREIYKKIGNFGGEIPREGFLERQISRGESVRRFIAGRHNITAGSMLDLGCSYGAAMIPFRDHGWNISGIDPEKGSVEYGRRELRLPVSYGMAEKLPYSDNSMDLVVSLGTLEHVYDFGSAMAEVIRVLKMGGYIFIRMRHNRPWGLIWEYYNRNHNRFFCEATHRLAAARYGFEVLEYSDFEIEGTAGYKYLVCRKILEPSTERVERLISKGLKDSPQALKSYLTRHHQEFMARAKELLEFVQSRNGDLCRAVKDIDDGRFSYTLLPGNRVDALKRAILEAKKVLNSS